MVCRVIAASPGTDFPVPAAVARISSGFRDGAALADVSQPLSDRPPMMPLAVLFPQPIRTGPAGAAAVSPAASGALPARARLARALAAAADQTDGASKAEPSVGVAGPGFVAVLARAAAAIAIPQAPLVAELPLQSIAPTQQPGNSVPGIAVLATLRHAARTAADVGRPDAPAGGTCGRAAGCAAVLAVPQPIRTLAAAGRPAGRSGAARVAAGRQRRLAAPASPEPLPAASRPPAPPPPGDAAPLAMPRAIPAADTSPPATPPRRKTRASPSRLRPGRRRHRSCRWPWRRRMTRRRSVCCGRSRGQCGAVRAAAASRQPGHRRRSVARAAAAGIHAARRPAAPTGRHDIAVADREPVAAPRQRRPLPLFPRTCRAALLQR